MIDEVVERKVNTLCSMCATHCGIELTVAGNTIVGVKPMKEHPVRRLCAKATAIPDLQYSRDRMLYPQKRINGKLQRVSWDEAMDTIVTKISYIKQKHGPQSLALYYGHELFVKETLGLMRLFCEAYGTPNQIDAGNVCGWPKFVACAITCGEDHYHEPSRAKLMINWALNNYHSQTPARHLLDGFKERGTKLIVIDTRRTYEAKKADLFLQPRSGTDLAIALAMMNVIIGEDLYDKAFVEKWTVGFDKLAEEVKVNTPEWAEGVTGVPAKDIAECARMYATIKPACIGTMTAMDQTTNSFPWYRSQTILAAITGNLDVAGGNKLVEGSPGRLLNMSPSDQGYVMPGKSITADSVPLYEEIIKEAHGTFFAETVLTGKPYPIKGMIVDGGNPLRSYPNTNKFIRALKELDFLAVMDVFPTDLTEYADVVLPSATFLEHRWAHVYVAAHLPLISVAEKVFEPAGEAWSDSKFWIELGRRMGYEDKFPWKDEDGAVEAALMEAAGKTFEDLAASPRGLFYAPKAPDAPAAERQEPFHTPSGKVEIYCERLEKLGYPPLPTPYVEPLESPVSTPELCKEFPIMATTGTRVEAYEHTWGRNLPRLRRIVPTPLVQTNPEDAKKYDLDDGEWVYIESPTGKCKMKVDISEDTPEGYISMPHGWGGESNVNLITSDEVLGPVTFTAVYKGVPCRFQKI